MAELSDNISWAFSALKIQIANDLDSAVHEAKMKERQRIIDALSNRAKDETDPMERGYLSGLVAWIEDGSK